MRYDDKNDRLRLREQLHETAGEPDEYSHVVFDFTGLERPTVGDLAMILTARLQSAPGDSVWVRSIHWQTARILEILKLDHLFRHYPQPADELN
jgi:hypothetical protein